MQHTWEKQREDKDELRARLGSAYPRGLPTPYPRKVQISPKNRLERLRRGRGGEVFAET